MSRLAFAILAALGVLYGCNREEGGEEKKRPIQQVILPTVALPAPRASAKIAEAKPSPPGEAPAAAPSKAPAAIAAAAPTAPPEPAETKPRAAMVGRGVDLRSEPSMDARIRGTFEGQTQVEVLKEEREFALVQAPVAGGGGFVEGWVLSASLRPAGAPGAVVQAPKAAAAAPAGKPAAAPKGAPPPVKAARAGDKGPDDILLKPIAGTAAKRPPTPFTHKKHYDDYGVKCAECHHLVKALGSKEPPQKTCTEAGCHTADQCNRQVVPAKNKACPFFEDAFHLNCIECHRSQKGPTKCAECHAG